MRNNCVLSSDNSKMILWNLEVKGKKDTDSNLWREGTKKDFV